jgi:hypothetical protein
VRVLGDHDLETAIDVASRDPIANVFVLARLETVGLDPRQLGAEVWGYAEDADITALCYSGANLVPVEAHAEAALAFAERARRQGRHCSSIVGPVEPVEIMWDVLAPLWGPARDVRSPQPLLATHRPSLVPADPLVRRVRPDELEIVLPACVAMFTEEVGVSPLAGDGGSLYRARVAELINDGRAFARIEDDRVVFKAEVGSATRVACQVQGVWVTPELRGLGIGTAGTAAVVDETLASISSVVSLYVNEYNVAARSAYARVGFREVGAFTSVLF